MSCKTLKLNSCEILGSTFSGRTFNFPDRDISQDKFTAKIKGFAVTNANEVINGVVACNSVFFSKDSLSNLKSGRYVIEYWADFKDVAVEMIALEEFLISTTPCACIDDSLVHDFILEFPTETIEYSVKSEITNIYKYYGSEILISVKNRKKDSDISDLESIQATIDYCEENGKICYIPDGNYFINDSIKVGNNSHIVASAGATINLMDFAGGDKSEMGVPMVINKNIVYPDTNLGIENYNITIDGGKWNGNGDNQNRLTGYCNLISYGFAFGNVRNIILKNLSIINTEAYALFVRGSENFYINNVSVIQQSGVFAPPLHNQDGLSFTRRTKNLKISNCFLRCGDDAIALNTSEPDCEGNFTINEDTDGVVISNIVIEGVKGIRLLSSGGAKMKNISVNNVTGKTSSTFIDIGSYSFQSNFIGENISFSNINIGFDETGYTLDSGSPAINFENQVNGVRFSNVKIKGNFWDNQIINFARNNIDIPCVVDDLIFDGLHIEGTDSTSVGIFIPKGSVVNGLTIINSSFSKLKTFIEAKETTFNNLSLIDNRGTAIQDAILFDKCTINKIDFFGSTMKDSLGNVFSMKNLSVLNTLNTNEYVTMSGGVSSYNSLKYLENSVQKTTSILSDGFTPISAIDKAQALTLSKVNPKNIYFWSVPTNGMAKNGVVFLEETAPYFRATFDTTKIETGSTSATQLKLVFSATNFQPITIYWGDGTKSDVPTYNSALLTHDYPIGGEYDVLIYGASYSFYWNNVAESRKLIGIIKNGNNVFVSGGFYGCSNNKTIGDDISKLDTITNGSNLFRDNAITSLPEGLTLNALITGTYMFSRCNLTTLPNAMKLSNLTGGNYMFFQNTINTSRYSQLLVDMNTSNPNNTVPFHGGNSKYNSYATSARKNLVTVKGWPITDGGLQN